MSDQDSDQLQPNHTPRSSLGSNNPLSYSSSSISPSTSSSGSHNSGKSAVSDCLSSWLNYLQNLNNLSASGYRLAQSISNLETISDSLFSSQQGAASSQPSSQISLEIIAAWQNLAQATTAATTTVKSHIISVLQDFITQTSNENESELQRLHVKDHNQSVVQENAQTMINLQHQFCVASIDLFGVLMVCSHCKTVVGQNHDNDCSLIQQQHLMKAHSGGDPRSSQFDRGSSSTQGSSEHQSTAFECRTSPSCYLDNVRGPLPNPGHLLGMKLPYSRGSRSPLNFPLFPLNGQRRWSEAAAEHCSESLLDPESQCRRWSMPDKTVHWSQTRIMPISKLAVPSSKTSGGDRSQTTTPDSTWQSSSVTSQDGLAEAIKLLSCRRGISYPPAFIEEPASQQEQQTEQQYGMWRQPQQQPQPPPSGFQGNAPPFPLKYLREHQPPYGDGKF